MKVLGYVRVSRVAGREGETFISPSVQREKIEAQAAAAGHVLVDVLEDLDQPGSKYQRPKFQEALQRVEAGEAEGIIVYALDRFARSVPDAAVALRRLDDVGGTLISVRDSLDTSTSVGRFARTMMLAIAELELERIRENWASARDRAIGRGVHISNVAPTGYRRADDGRLEPDPVTAPVVRELFIRRAAGTSWRDLSTFLEQQLPRENGGAWPLSTVQSIIRRRTYLGEAAAGDVVNRDAHPAIVTRGEWEAAQRSAPRGARSSDGGALLQGIVRCAACGGIMSRVSDGRRGYTNYKCRSRSAGNGVCPSPSRVSTRKADAHVERLFLDWMQQERIRLQASATSDEIATAVAHVEAAEAELAAYRDMNLVSVIGKDAYLAGLEQRAAAVNDAISASEATRRQSGLDELLTVDLAATWPHLSTAERRTILAAAIESVDVIRDGVPGNGSPAERRVSVRWR